MKQHQYRNGLPQIIGWFDDFAGPHEFQALSNFYVGEPLVIELLDSVPFATGEHAFAAMKAVNRDEYEAIRDAPDPALAKALGRSCVLRDDWEAVKYDAMMAVLRAKFTLNRYEGTVLLNTKDALLIEGTHWRDQVWGVDLRDDSAPANHAPGRNWLGTLLMARRAELLAERLFGVKHPTGMFNTIFARI